MPTSTTRDDVRAFRLRAVLFDFDGTLTEPGALDFAAIKRELGCPPDRFVLEWIESLPSAARRVAAMGALERFEVAAAARSRPNAGAEEALQKLRDQGLAVGVLTRNGRAAVERALGGFPTLGVEDFDVVVTRDDGLPPKPAPDGVLHAACIMGVAAHEMLVVGDYELDLQAGRAAGALTAFLTNGNREAASHASGRVPNLDVDCRGGGERDFTIVRLADLDAVVRRGLQLPYGKLPNDLLSEHLGRVDVADPALLVAAGVGEDVAAMDLGSDRVLVTHSDPITLGGSDLARAAVAVNANDIAAAGADPRWLLATVLLPAGTTASQALALLTELAAAAGDAGMVIAGGHTEVTPAVIRTIVAMTAIGTVQREGLRDKRDVRPGDLVLLTKALAIEGTALLAEELGIQLRASGMTDAELDACRGLLPHIAIVREAAVARQFAGVRAMHDVTEGGLATALRELATATGLGLRIHVERVPVEPLTARLCGLLGADPLGLLASGSLLICCRPADEHGLVAALAAEGIAAVTIAEVREAGTGITALRGGDPWQWPEFAVDEAARLLANARPSGK